jgi:EpsI family protein
MTMARYWTVCMLLVLTALILTFRGYTELRPRSEPLRNFPENIADWNGTDQAIDAASLEVLGPGDFLSRTYTQDPSVAPIDLFLGFFATQRTGVAIHSPKHCLPGAGWVFESSRMADLKDAGGRFHQVGEYVIANGDRRLYVIYWYQAHGRSLASEYSAKLYLVVDALRMNRTDGALVRVLTPIASPEADAQARSRAEAFTTQLFPLLPRFVPD